MIDVIHRTTSIRRAVIRFIGPITSINIKFNLFYVIKVPVLLLCPCQTGYMSVFPLGFHSSRGAEVCVYTVPMWTVTVGVHSANLHSADVCAGVAKLL